jgi:hypothetical protein
MDTGKLAGSGGRRDTCEQDRERLPGLKQVVITS